jgi:glycerophosphoryl diester phosphodiesterase
MTLLIAWGQRVHLDVTGQPPGNSLQLVDRAYELGYDGVELDLQLSKDGVLVLMHNDTIDETTEARGAVASMMHDALRAVRLKDPYGYGSPCFVPTFEEALRVNGSRGKVMVDIRRIDSRHLDALHAATQGADFDPALFLFLAYDRDGGFLMKREFPRSTVMLKAPANLTPPALTVDFADRAEGLDAIIVPTADSIESTAEFQEAAKRRGLKLGTYLFHRDLGHLLRLMKLGLFAITAVNPVPFAEARARHRT